MEELSPFHFQFGWVYQEGNVNRNMFSPRVGDVDESNLDFGVRLAGQWADRLTGGLYPMDGAKLGRLRSAQQQDADLITLVAWMHGNQPSLDVVRTSSPDLQ